MIERRCVAVCDICGTVAIARLSRYAMCAEKLPSLRVMIAVGMLHRMAGCGGLKQIRIFAFALSALASWI